MDATGSPSDPPGHREQARRSVASSVDAVLVGDSERARRILVGSEDPSVTMRDITDGIRARAETPLARPPDSRSAADGPVVELAGIPDDSERESVAALVEDHLRDSRAARSADAARTCVTTSPGTFVDLGPARDLLANPPANIDPVGPLSIMVLPNGTDALVLDIFGWATRGNPPDTARVSLASAHGWDKEILTWTVCPPHERRRITKTGGPGLDGTLTISAADGEDALVFRKPGFLGIWGDVFYLDMPAVIELFGGRFARFTWYRA